MKQCLFRTYIYLHRCSEAPVLLNHLISNLGSQRASSMHKPLIQQYLVLHAKTVFRWPTYFKVWVMWNNSPSVNLPELRERRRASSFRAYVPQRLKPYCLDAHCKYKIPNDLHIAFINPEALLQRQTMIWFIQKVEMRSFHWQ